MDILAFHKKHDSTMVQIRDGQLIYSVEAEKDSNPRFAFFTEERLQTVQSMVTSNPDLIALSGWNKFHAGYEGLEAEDIHHWQEQYRGRLLPHFSSSHERAHILCAYGLSPFPAGEPCYVLVWEGALGSFYKIDAHLNITRLGTPLLFPGRRFAYLFELGKPGHDDESKGGAMDVAGKLMALTGFAEGPLQARERDLVEAILNVNMLDTRKGDFRDQWVYNVGVEDAGFKRAAKALTEVIFQLFHQFAAREMTEGYPLLISGGCGLNCTWNRRWEDSGLFADVFVPPCTNDTGVALGTAVDAQFHHTGNAKVSWDVYVGEAFEEDVPVSSEFEEIEGGTSEVARYLAVGKVIAWAHGRCEMGPRALGNRSLLAAPFPATHKERLNEIKQREGYRPIAPICLEEDMGLWFDRAQPSPYMLYFTQVIRPGIEAVMHVDGSSRVQSVNRGQNSAVYDLLRAFKDQTGIGVLCNTSLNFKGKGFINRTSDLMTYVRERGIDGMVIDGRFYLLKK